MIQQINAADNILIISHVNPDGDTLGSMCAMYCALKKHGKKPLMLIQGALPEIYRFLPCIKEAKSYCEKNFKAENFDLVITVDVASVDRIVEEGKKAFNNAKTTICFDHHKTNRGYADFNVINPDASSTGEVLYDFFTDNNIPITKDIAICLYSAILTDTGGFKYESTKARTFNIVSELVKKGANPCEIYRLCYESKPKAMVLFQAYCIENAVFLEQDKIVYTYVTKEGLKKFHAKDEHTDGICEALRQINTVEIAAVLKEVDENTTKISLRSKNLSVSDIAQTFGGGGHEFAAGCTIRKPLNIAKDKLLEKICQKQI